MVTVNSNPNAWEAEAEGMQVHTKTGLQSQFEASVDNTARLCSKNKKLLKNIL